jgi:hypothetical protein
LEVIIKNNNLLTLNNDVALTCACRFLKIITCSKQWKCALISRYFYTESNGGIFIFIAFTEPKIWICKKVSYYWPSFSGVCRPGLINSTDSVVIWYWLIDWLHCTSMYCTFIPIWFDFIYFYMLLYIFSEFQTISVFMNISLLWYDNSE